jgi:hypothetical protein
MKFWRKERRKLLVLFRSVIQIPPAARNTMLKTADRRVKGSQFLCIVPGQHITDVMTVLTIPELGHRHLWLLSFTVQINYLNKKRGMYALVSRLRLYLCRL